MSQPITTSEGRTNLCKTCAAFKAFDGRGSVACRAHVRFLDLEKDTCPVWANGGGPPPILRLDTLTSPPESVDPASRLSVTERTEALQPVCVACPSNAFRGFTQGGSLVNCERNKGVCCGGTGGPQFLRQAFAGGVCPAGHWSSALKDFATFDAATVLTLARRSDRLKQFWDTLNITDWPFRRPEPFFGVDGTKVPQPSGWSAGAGAWGCLQSHRQIIEKYLSRDTVSLLVLEDDATFCPDFRRRVSEFLGNIPDDWDGIMFGGQHMRPPEYTGRLGVVRCLDTQRTHGFAMRRRLMEDLYKLWSTSQTHCDHTFAGVIADYRVYAPSSFFIGQRAGHSDITCNDQGTRFWQSK